MLYFVDFLKISPKHPRNHQTLAVAGMMSIWCPLSTYYVPVWRRMCSYHVPTSPNGSSYLSHAVNIYYCDVHACLTCSHMIYGVQSSRTNWKREPQSVSYARL